MQHLGEPALIRDEHVLWRGENGDPVVRPGDPLPGVGVPVRGRVPPDHVRSRVGGHGTADAPGQLEVGGRAAQLDLGLGQHRTGHTLSSSGTRTTIPRSSSRRTTTCPTSAKLA